MPDPELYSCTQVRLHVLGKPYTVATVCGYKIGLFSANLICGFIAMKYTPACFRRFVSDKEGLVSLIKVIDQFHVEFTMNEMYRTLCNCLKDSCLLFLALLLVSTVMNDVKTLQPRPFYAKFSIHYCLRNWRTITRPK